MRILKFLLIALVLFIIALLTMRWINDHYKDSNKRYLRDHLLRSSIERKLPATLPEADKDLLIELSTNYIERRGLVQTTINNDLLRLQINYIE